MINGRNSRNDEAAPGSPEQNVAPLIDVRNLQIVFDHQFGPISVVKGVSFDVARGGSVALVGESGAGKSIVARAILGLLPPSARIAGGEIIFRDPNRPNTPIDLAAIAPGSNTMLDVRGGRIAMIFQEPMTSLSPFHTIGWQIEEALSLHRNVSSAESRELVVETLRLCGFPDPAQAVQRYAFELSGGLRQRAMIAMALVCRPALLIADEPTTALDVSIQAQILGLIREMQSELDMALLMITHDLGVVANVADEVVVLFHGEVMERGRAERLFRTPEHPYLKALFAAVPHFDMKPGERLVPLRKIPRQSGGNVKPPAPAEEGPLLDVSGLTKSFHTRASGFLKRNKAQIVTAVDNVSFQIGQREVVGLVGESGSGKTTLSKMVLRALTPDSGELVFHGRKGREDLTAADCDTTTLSQAIQMVFQDPFSSLNPRMTILDIIREPLVIHKLGSRTDHVARVKDLMQLVGLAHRHLNRYPHSLSGGQRQRVALARALVLNPELLILDEPTSALDVSIQAQILNLLSDLRSELGLSYLFVSHNLAVVDYISDRILVMAGGRIVEQAPRETLFRAPIHCYTKALMAAVPYPDLERKLDLSTAGFDGVGNPDSWADPFRISPSRAMTMLEVGDRHNVLVQEGTDKGALLP